MNLFYFSLLLMTLSTALPALGTLSVGSIPEVILLENESGGLLNGEKWSSSSIQKKVHVLFYVDPDESDLNKKLTVALKAENFPKSEFASIAVINMKATWKPNFAIESILKDKQKKHPHTTYVRDFNKALVSKWQLADDNNDVVLFDRAGKVLMSVDGQLSDQQISELIALIKRNL